MIAPEDVIEAADTALITGPAVGLFTVTVTEEMPTLPTESVEVSNDGCCAALNVGQVEDGGFRGR